VAAYQAALQNVTYYDTSLNPDPTPRTLAFTVHDGVLASAPLLRNVTVIPVDDAPVLAGPQTPATYQQEGNATAVLTALQASDVDNAQLAYAKVQLSGDYRAAEDRLSVTVPNGISPQFDSATGTLTLTGPASLADFQQALRNVVYDNTSSHGREGQLTVTVTVNDGERDSNLYQTTLTLEPINQAPVLIKPLGNFTVTVDEPFELSLDKTVFTDPDNDELSYTAEAPLLSELEFDPANFTLSGLLNHTEAVPVMLQARDNYNGSSYGRFFILPKAATTSTLSTVLATLTTLMTATTGSTSQVATSTGGLTDTTGPDIIKGSSSHDGPNVGLIVGTTIGALTLLLCLMAVIFLYRKKHQEKEQEPTFSVELTNSMGHKL
jgi:hypothetical protein